MSMLSVLFGNYSKRELKRIQPICDAVLKLEEQYKAMTDEDFAFACTHLSNTPLMQHNAADNLYGEVAHPQHPRRGFPAGGERLRQNNVIYYKTSIVKKSPDERRA